MHEKDISYPDDDGKLQRAWVKESNERGGSSSNRVFEVFQQRCWVKGNLRVSVANDSDDSHGYDMFVPMDNQLLKILRISPEEYGVPVQVKSNDRSIRSFLNRHKVAKSGNLTFRNGDYIFIFNGQNAKDLILADLVGQMIILAQASMDEDSFLGYLAKTMGDAEAVAVWKDNREIIKDSWWYRKLLQ